MTTSVVIPTWNGARRVERVLASVGDGAQVIVVDNGSTDGTLDLLASRFRDVDVISLPRNEGFSRAVNRAARVAAGDCLVLLNDDCVCEHGFVDRLAAALDPARSVVMAAGVLVECGDAGVIDSAGIELDETLLVFDYLNGSPVSVLADGVEDPMGPSGAAAAFDRDAFLATGGFDESLFAYWEDVDLVLRLRNTGATCRLVPSARAQHAHSSTLGSGSRRKNYLTGFGRGYVIRKWGVLDHAGVPSTLARELALCAAQIAIDRNASGLRGRIDGWRAAQGTERHSYTAAVGTRRRRSIVHELRRRSRRRRRLRDPRFPP